MDLLFTVTLCVCLCVCLLQPSLFGSKAAGFGTTTTSAPSFGTGTGLFGNKPTLTLGSGTNTSTFGKSSSRDTLIQSTAEADSHLTPVLLVLVQVLVQILLERVCLVTSRLLEDWGLDWEPASEQVPEENMST